MGLFSTASKETRGGVDFLPDGIAVAQVHAGRQNPGGVLRAEFIQASGQEAQAEALGKWVRANGLQKAPEKMAMYRQNLEQLDWKLLWDEIEVVGEECPTVTLKLVLSTLSTRREWIEI